MKVRICLCGRPLPPKHRRYCSRVCYGRERHRWTGSRPLGRTDLALFLASERDGYRKQGMTQNQLARDIGVSAAALVRYLAGCTPTAPAYGQLQRFFGLDLPVVKTETARRREQALNNCAALRKRPEREREERARGAGAAGRGHSKPESFRRALRARHQRGRLDSESRGERYMADSAKRLTRFVTSVHGRAAVSLGKYLDATPSPTREQIRAMAAAVASNTGMTVHEVKAGWRPMLRARGLEKTGRPPNERRHRLLVELMDGWTRTTTGQLAPGFWKEAARQVTALETSTINHEDLRVWWNQHRTRCADARRRRLG